MKLNFSGLKNSKLQRMISLLLVCVLFAALLPGGPALATDAAQSDDPGEGSGPSIVVVNNTTKVKEWFQIKKQSDFPAAGTYPMLLMYYDDNGDTRILKNTGMAGGSIDLFRDGVNDGSHGTNFKNYANNRLKAEYEAEYPGKLDPMTNIEKAKALDEYGKTKVYYKKAYAEELRSNRCVLYGGVNAMYSSPLSETPAIPYDADYFLTKNAPVNWTMTVTGGTSSNGEHNVKIHAGSRSFVDGEGWLYSDWGREAELELSSSKADEYRVYTAELGTDRRGWTEDGMVQIYWYDSDGYDSGLVHDGRAFGSLESKKDRTYYNYSNFMLFYGREKELSAITYNYTVQDGSIMYADNNMILMDGVNLNIAPGGILCVTGNFYCNGIINNGGTIILNPGATITTLEPPRTNSCQINCYGAKSVNIDFSTGKAEVDNEIDPIEVQKLIEIAQRESDDLQAFIEELAVLDKYEFTDAEGNTQTLTDEEFERFKERQESEKDIKDEQITEYKRQLKEYEERQNSKSNPSGSVSFSKCQGDILIMEGATLDLCTRSESRLNLYGGASCVNNGLIIAPNGINVDNAELINRKTGTVFCGYYFQNAPGVNCASRVVGAGTADATVKGLSLKTGSITALSLGSTYHVKNEGAILAHGTVSGTVGAPNWEGNGYTAK